MVDTPRTEAELLAIFAPNASGDISSQDMRDFVVSVPDLVGVLGLYTIDSDVELDVGVVREVDFTGQTADRDTLGITWDEDLDQFVVPEDGIYKIDVYALTYLGPIDYITDFPFTYLAIFHDADEANPRSSRRDDEPAHYLSLTIPLTAGQGWSIGITAETDDPSVTTISWRCVVQVARLSAIEGGGGGGVNGDIWRAEADDSSHTGGDDLQLVWFETESASWIELDTGDHTLVRFLEDGVYLVTGHVLLYPVSTALQGAQYIFTTAGTPDFVDPLAQAQFFLDAAHITGWQESFTWTKPVVAGQAFKLVVYGEGDNYGTVGRIQVTKLS